MPEVGGAAQAGQLSSGELVQPGVYAPVLAFVRAQGAPAWLVGGSVRDLLMGRPSHDLDLIVGEGGIRLAKAIAQRFRGGFFVLDAERDVARAVVRINGQSLSVDVARLRAPELLDDLAHRDFTVNAMALPVEAGLLAELVDPFDGRADLTRRLVRAVSEGAFVDDPLRMLRALRQSIELGLEIEEATYYLIRRDARYLQLPAAERVRDELVRILEAPGAADHLLTLSRTDLLPQVLPEAAAQLGVEQSAPHYLDVFDHTRAVMGNLENLLAWLSSEALADAWEPKAGDPIEAVTPEHRQAVTRLLEPHKASLRQHLQGSLATGRSRRSALVWAALAHDWGKPVSQQVEPNGRVRFFGHDLAGAELARARMAALAFSTAETELVRTVVALHMRPVTLLADEEVSTRALYHLLQAAGDATPELVLLFIADHLALRFDLLPAATWPRLLKLADRLLDAYFGQHTMMVRPRPLLNGTQLMAEFGLPAGPQIGQLITDLCEAQAVGEVRSMSEARAWVAARLR